MDPAIPVLSIPNLPSCARNAPKLTPLPRRSIEPALEIPSRKLLCISPRKAADRFDTDQSRLRRSIASGWPYKIARKAGTRVISGPSYRMRYL